MQIKPFWSAFVLSLALVVPAVGQGARGVVVPVDAATEPEVELVQDACSRLWSLGPRGALLKGQSSVASVLVEGSATTSGPPVLDYRVVTSPSAGLVVESLEWFDWTERRFVGRRLRLLGVGTAPSAITSGASGGASIVEPGTGRVRARIQLAFLSGAPPIAVMTQVSITTTHPLDVSFFNFRGFDSTQLNSGATWLRTVTDLGTDRMVSTATGTRLSIDAASAGPYNWMFRSELREQDNQSSPAPGSTQVYRLRFAVEQLPTLYGPVTIFQRFSTLNDGPDIEVELTRVGQLAGVGPNIVQVVDDDDRIATGVMLAAENDLVVMIHNDVNGKYRVLLNGQILFEKTDYDTLAAPTGSWVQFGLYPHGFQNATQRANQVASGQSVLSFMVRSFEKWSFPFELQFERFVVN